MIVLCPFARSERAEAVSAMARAQTIPVRLLVVENAGARFTQHADQVLRLESADAVGALNLGLAWLRQHAPSEKWCRWDDDDRYLPRFCEDAAEALERADWSGIPDATIRLMNGSRVRLDSYGRQICTGGSLAARVSAALDFIPGSFPADDYAWCEAMTAAGRTFAARSPDTYERIRHRGCSTAHIPDEAFELTCEAIA